MLMQVLVPIAFILSGQAESTSEPGRPSEAGRPRPGLHQTSRPAESGTGRSNSGLSGRTTASPSGHRRAAEPAAAGPGAAGPNH